MFHSIPFNVFNHPICSTMFFHRIVTQQWSVPIHLLCVIWLLFLFWSKFHSVHQGRTPRENQNQNPPSMATVGAQAPGLAHTPASASTPFSASTPLTLGTDGVEDGPVGKVEGKVVYESTDDEVNSDDNFEDVHHFPKRFKSIHIFVTEIHNYKF